jgi:ADP-L-glycero-D-manno-heptose 6-epimerase
MASSRYLVTGGAGFVGANLCAELLRRDPDAAVTILDDCSSGTFLNVVQACERTGVGPFRGRFLPYALAEVDWHDLIDVEQPDALFHLAALTDTTVADERRMMLDNATTFPEILQACTDAAVALVYASSAATYGSPPHADRREPFPVDAAGAPNNVYGFSKWQMECEHRRFMDSDDASGAHIVGLRYFNVFGPGEARKGKMASMALQLTRQILAGRRPRLFADGAQARDQVHVDDVVSCTIAAAGLGDREHVDSGIYNAGSGVATTFNDIVDAIRDALDIADLPTEYFDMPPDVREFYQDYTCADMADTAAGIGFTPQINPLEGVAAYARILQREHAARRGAHP